MKVFMIGGTGLIGSLVAKELINEGHYVTSLALPPIPKSSLIPGDMKLTLKDFNKLSDSEILKLMQDCKIFIFAAGIDERIPVKEPIYDKYYKYNIAPLERLLPLAKQAKVSHSVILGSYFAYFDREWKDLGLSKKHPYIKSRVVQEKVALSFADNSMTISVVELPYIFGAQKGRKPVWTILVEQIQKMKLATFYPKGGSTMITANQAGKLIANIALNNKKSKAIPVGYYNLSWRKMLEAFHEALNLDRRIINIPKWIYNIGLKSYSRKQKRQGYQQGLNLKYLSEIMYREAYIDKRYIEEYNVPEDDIVEAIKESVKLSCEVLEDDFEIVGMKFE